MRLTLRQEYALLFALYLDRAGKATTAVAAENLGIPKSVLDQITFKLSRAGLTKSTRGVNGGHELTGNHSAIKIIVTVGPVNANRKGPLMSTEARAYFHWISSFFNEYSPLYVSIRSINQKIVAAELRLLDEVDSDV